MLHESDLKELYTQDFRDPVLSLFLNTAPENGNADAYRLELRSLLRKVDAPADAEQIENYFDHEYDWSGRSVAVFSCAPAGYFKAFPLAVPIQSLVRLSSRPYIKPLADLWDAYGGYAVALVDRQGARLFSFHMGMLEEQEGYLGEEVRHIKSGESSSLAGVRGGAAGKTSSVDEQTNRNFKAAAAFSASFFEKTRARRIILGGTDENVSVFRQLLPKTWQSLVAGTFHSPITASQAEVLAKAIRLGSEAEKAQEASLVEQAITAAAKGSGGAVGLEAVLAATADHRVHVLLVSGGYYSTGAQCTACGRLTASAEMNCPTCSAAFRRELDVVDLAITDVLQSGGDVAIVHENTQLKSAGKIAALLRY
jgi:peptide subunit release factor 1 (eRF1)